MQWEIQLYARHGGSYDEGWHRIGLTTSSQHSTLQRHGAFPTLVPPSQPCISRPVPRCRSRTKSAAQAPTRSPRASSLGPVTPIGSRPVPNPSRIVQRSSGTVKRRSSPLGFAPKSSNRILRCSWTLARAAMGHCVAFSPSCADPHTS